MPGKPDVLTFQKVMNNFTDKRLVGVPRITEDGRDGKQTRNRVLQCKWWLGYTDGKRDRELDVEFMWRLRNPLTSSTIQGHAAITRGQKRRDAQKARAKRLREDDVSSPLVWTVDSWGWAPPVHDGIDLICAPDAPLFAICDGEIVRASDSGWWGKGAQASGGHPVSDGDGIIIVRCSISEGPFKPGLNFCYGHAENPMVTVGQKVQAGDPIGFAGFANAWHIHMMVNDDPDVGGFYRGIGDRDPRPFTDYARER